MTPTGEFGKRGFHPQGSRRPATPAETGKMRPLVIGIVIGVVATSAYVVVSLVRSPVMPLLMAELKLAHNSIDFSGTRIGRSSTAPALPLCVTKNMVGVDESIEVTPDILLTALKGDPRDRVTREPGTPREHAVIELAQMWGDVADCVYHQNTFRLCDIDNRALAVEAGSIFIRQSDTIAAQPPATYAAQPGEIQALQSVRGRVLAAMQNQVQNGVLIAADFPSSFAPPAVRKMLNETETLHNACATKK